MLLVIDTATTVLSLALLGDDRVVAAFDAELGRGHAEALVPAIATLLAGHPRPTGVLVDTGPGSFTGLRVGIAAARALALAWEVPVAGFASTALIAAAAFAHAPALADVVAAIDAGRGHVYLQRFARGGGATDAPSATRPEAAASLLRGCVVAGPAAAALAVFAAVTVVAPASLSASDARFLAPGARAASVAPTYVAMA